MRKLSRTKQILDESQKTLNSRYEALRSIIDTLERYGVTDKDFEGFSPCDYKANDYIAAALDKANQSDIDEALDLCSVLNSLQEPRKWPFRRKPKDQTTKALVERLKVKYYAIAG